MCCYNEDRIEHVLRAASISFYFIFLNIHHVYKYFSHCNETKSENCSKNKIARCTKTVHTLRWSTGL